MSHTREQVRLRKPCPCGQGEILLSYHLAVGDGHEGYFDTPKIVCALCVKRFQARLFSDPDRVELTPTDPSEQQAVTYLVESSPLSHPNDVDHA